MIKTTKEITGVNCNACGDEIWACTSCRKIIHEQISARLTPEQKAYDNYVTRRPSEETNEQ